MSRILSIGTAVPVYEHKQQHIMEFMQRVYALDETENRKLRFLYRQSGIGTRYSVIPDYSLPANEWEFFPATENLQPFPSLENRMSWYRRHATPLSVDAIGKCLGDRDKNSITHLITVSCTGLSAPGLDIDIIRAMSLPVTIQRFSINFMGCFAAVQALKMADAFCRSDPAALVLIVCTELCTLHFQKEPVPDNITSSMLFGDGSAAVLVAGGEGEGTGISHFHSTIAEKGINDMSWEVSSKGFLMTLSSYVPQLIEQDFKILLDSALSAAGVERDQIGAWCIHPGGKKILEAVAKSAGLPDGALDDSYDVLEQYGNMSSPTILFVLERLLRNKNIGGKIAGAAFGPGLTIETFILTP